MRKNTSAKQRRLLTPKHRIDVLISFLDKQFSDKLNVFLYKQYFAKTQFHKNMINFTTFPKISYLKNKVRSGAGSQVCGEIEFCGYNIMPGCLLSRY